VIDFDAAARDPNRPAHILATFDSIISIRRMAGYKAMADSIDLKTLTARPVVRHDELHRAIRHLLVS